MKILVTGYQGFVGKNLSTVLREKGHEVLGVGRSDSVESLKQKLEGVDFVCHLAAANRPDDKADFLRINRDFTADLMKTMSGLGLKVPVLFSSSTQALVNNEYGASKLKAEQKIIEHSNETSNKVYILRLPNLFGKWCKPFYNSVVATWCQLLSTGSEIQFDDPSKELSLMYIDDVVQFFVDIIDGKYQESKDPYLTVPSVTKATLGELSSILKSFSEGLSTHVPKVSDKLTKNLYSTYCSYQNPETLTKDLVSHADPRGVFMEVFREIDGSQVSISTSKVGVDRGSHYHHSKCEKFVVLRGKARVRFRKIDEDKVFIHELDASNPQIITIPPGYTHDIANISDEEMILLIWANENFNAKGDDTHAKDVHED